jgi:perosamine synthetase
MIPLSRSLLGPEEAAALSGVLDSGRLVQGERVARFEALVAARVGRKHAIAMANGTAALELALTAVGVARGDEVLVPDLTWPSPGHAVLSVGAWPSLVDVDAHEWNMRGEAAHAARTPLTAAAILIDQFGCPARVAEVAAALPGVPLIVDAACSLGSHDGQLPCGKHGVIACLSFHPRKVVTTGEGGMCLTDDDALAEQLRVLRNHGQIVPGTFRRAAGNERMSELAAALGEVQLGRLDGMLPERQLLAARYARELAALDPQRLPEGARGNHQTFGVVLPPHIERDALLARLRERGVEAGKLSYALHTLPQFQSAAQACGRSFPNAERLAAQGIALPLYVGLTPAEQTHVIESLRSVLAS